MPHHTAGMLLLRCQDPYYHGARVHANSGVLTQEPGTMLLIGCWACWNLTPPLISVTQAACYAHWETCSMPTVNRCNRLLARVLFAVIKSSTAVRVVHLCFVNCVIVHPRCTFPVGEYWNVFILNNKSNSILSSVSPLQACLGPGLGGSFWWCFPLIVTQQQLLAIK